MPVISNPQNPSGQTRHGTELRDLIEMAEKPEMGCYWTRRMRCFTAPQSAVSNSSRILTTAISSGRRLHQGVAVPRYSNWMGNRKQEKISKLWPTTLAFGMEESVIHPNTMLLSCSSPIGSGGPGSG